jgi:hypothetical protein
LETDISALFQISVNLIMEVVQMWHASFQESPGETNGSAEEPYRPRHRPQDDA